MQSLDISNGVLIVTFGHEANAAINGLTVTITPYESPDLSIVWRCGTAPATGRLSELGTAGGGTWRDYTAADGPGPVSARRPAGSSRRQSSAGALTPDQRRTSGESMPNRSSTRPTVWSIIASRLSSLA